MNKLLSAHFARLKKDKCFRICVLFMVFMAVYRLLDSYLMIKDYHAFISLESPFFTYIMLAAILSPVFVSLFLGTEFNDGTIRNKLIVGHTRADIYLSSLILCIIAGILTCVAYIVPSLCIGIPVLGFFRADIRIILGTAGCALLLSMAYTAICTFVAMLNQNRAISAVICILGVFLSITVSAYIQAQLNEPETWKPYTYISETGEIVQEPETSNPYYIGGVKRDVYEFMSEFLPSGQTVSLSSLSAANPSRMALYSGLITILTTGFGIYLFRKRDIK